MGQKYPGRCEKNGRDFYGMGIVRISPPSLPLHALGERSLQFVIGLDQRHAHT